MSQELLTAILTIVVSVAFGLVTGGAGVLIVYDRAVQSVMNSPVIIKSLEGAFASLPAPIKADVIDTVKLADQIVQTTTTTTATPAA